jgi:alpha-mannosidase
MKRSALPLLLAALALFLLLAPASLSETADPNKPVLDRLDSLTHQPETEWRFHGDVPHPEDPTLNDSDWGVWTVKNVSGPGGQNANEEHWTGTRVFRRWVQIPEKIHGYTTQGSRVWMDLRFGSPGSLLITVFSSGAMLYRGDDDNILPVLLTENAEPGHKFLVAVRVVAGDSVPAEFFQSELTIDAVHSRPNPALLRLELLAVRPIVAAYEEGKAEREQQLDAAGKAIDFSTLDRGDQAGFDASLQAAHAKLRRSNPGCSSSPFAWWATLTSTWPGSGHGRKP